MSFFVELFFLIFSLFYVITLFIGGDIISNIFTKLFFILFILVLFISIFFTPIIKVENISDFLENGEILFVNPNGFVWPIPGYTRISSPFGKRNSPTAGASSYHYGCDIPAPQGTKLIAIADGEITFLNFLGAGGYTLTLSFDNYKVSYCHIDPNFLVSVGDFVKQGQVIALVGPKYVYGVPGNLYKDKNGNPTNGATTGSHLHIGFRINNQYQNPMNFF